MTSKYVKWRKPRGGVKRESGEGRSCMLCGKAATHTAVKRNGKFVMDVWFCTWHKNERQQMDE